MRRLFNCLALFAAISLAATGVLIGCGDEDDGSERLLVLGAASLDTAISEYAEAFAESAGAEVRTSFAGSDQLATQIRQGAAADVFASADLNFPAQLHSEGLVDEPLVFATNSLVIAVPAESSIGSLSDLAEPGVDIVIGDASVPIGAYTRDALDQIPSAQQQAILANVRSEEPDVGSVIAKLVQEVADAVFVYNTDVAAAGDGLRAIPLPEELQPEVAYAVAVVSDSGAPELVAEFVAGLIEGEGAASLRRAGFLPPP